MVAVADEIPNALANMTNNAAPESRSASCTERITLTVRTTRETTKPFQLASTTEDHRLEHLH